MFGSHPCRSVLTLALLAGLQSFSGWQSHAVAAQTADQAAVFQMLHNGRDAMQRGDLATAERLFRSAAEAAPTLSDAFLGLGLTQLRRGELDDSVKSLTRATGLNPQLRGAHLFLGLAQYQAGQNVDAAQSLRAELNLSPDNIEALTWLGIVELGSDHPEEAIAPLDRAVALHPNDAQLLYYQARAHGLVAKSALTRLYQLDPDSMLVHRAMAENLDASGQPEKAIAEYELALKKQPDNPDLLEALGDTYQKVSRFDDARKAYQHELALNPHNAIALYNLGKIDVEHGQPEEGVAKLREAEAAHARPAPTDFYLGLGLAETGHPEEAAHWLEQSLANNPSPFIEQSAYFQLARVYQRLNRKEDAQQALEKLKQLKAQAAPDAPQSVDASSNPPPQP
jgi:tetratricopeptide (TPR) repeat protein